MILKILNFLWGLFRLIRAIFFILLFLFAIVVAGELTHCNGSSSSTPDNAVHWRP